MKKILLFPLIAFFLGGLLYSQTPPKFTLTKDGVKPVVLNFDASFTANQIYTRIKEWVLAYYKDPKAPIRVDKENTLVKVGGYKEKGWKIRANNFDNWYVLEYTLTIEIKPAKCRVTFETPETRYKVWFNSNGTVIPKFKDSKASFEATMNEFLTTLNDQIKGAKKKPADDW
jgi:hypothetical protein